jgi:hypothetical protein
MWILIGTQIASKTELEEQYDLDEALKLFALWRMQQDIEAHIADDLKSKVKGGR